MAALILFPMQLVEGAIERRRSQVTMQVELADESASCHWASQNQRLTDG